MDLLQKPDPTLPKVSPEIAILLCTYQGQDHLAEQLDSFEAQKYTHWTAWASDDGSKDGTKAILETYKKKWGEKRLSIHTGPRKGFAANFLSLVCNTHIQADYYAYSDQDDIWEPNKLQRAIDQLQTVPAKIPALYFSRTRLVNEENQDIGFSLLFHKSPSFANALMQNIGGGNTMVYNESARRILCAAGQEIGVISHDWWTYMVVSGCGGRIFYDTRPSLRYRQHAGNLIGMNSTWLARWKRIKMLAQGHFKDWNERNIHALRRLYPQLTPENKEVFDRFVEARSRALLPRLIGLKRSGIYRQTLLGNLGLLAAALFKRM